VLAAGFLWIDCSTIDVESARETHKSMKAIGIDFVDAYRTNLGEENHSQKAATGCGGDG
jgi:hypothetical protein